MGRVAVRRLLPAGRPGGDGAADGRRPDSTVPNIGASGAIAAVLGGYLVLYPAGPRADVGLPHRLLRVHRAAGAALPRDLVRPAGAVRPGRLHRPDGGGGGVAYFAHIGGLRRSAPWRSGPSRRACKPGFGRDDPARAIPSTEPVRTTLLVVVLVFVAALLALTIYVAGRRGPDVLTLLSRARPRAARRGRRRRAAPSSAVVRARPAIAVAGAALAGLAGCGGGRRRRPASGSRAAGPARRRPPAAGRQRPGRARRARAPRPLAAAHRRRARTRSPCASTTSPAAGLLFDLDTGRGPVAALPDAGPADRQPDEDDDRAARGRPLPPRATRPITRAARRATRLGGRRAAQGPAGPGGDAAARAAAAVGQRRRRRAGAARGRLAAGVRRADERAGPRHGPGLHALRLPERLRRRRQPLLRGRPGRSSPAPCSTSRAWRASSRRRQAVLPASRSRAGTLYLYNNNPLLRTRLPGHDGVKTGYTDAAGHCLVAAARRGGRRAGGRAAALAGHPHAGPEAADGGSRPRDGWSTREARRP